RQRGVYLITGGLGGLGSIVSSHLVKTLNCNLVLCGRSEPGPREQSELEQLRSRGSGILYVRADVAKLSDAEAVVAAAKARFGRLDGVIHCAGVHQDALIANKQTEQIERVLAPKVHGALNLDFATRGEQLDVFVMF